MIFSNLVSQNSSSTTNIGDLASFVKVTSVSKLKNIPVTSEVDLPLERLFDIHTINVYNQFRQQILGGYKSLVKSLTSTSISAKSIDKTVDKWNKEQNQISNYKDIFTNLWNELFYLGHETGTKEVVANFSSMVGGDTAPNSLYSFADFAKDDKKESEKTIGEIFQYTSELMRKLKEDQTRIELDISEQRKYLIQMGDDRREDITTLRQIISDEREKLKKVKQKYDRANSKLGILLKNLDKVDLTVEQAKLPITKAGTVSLKKPQVTPTITLRAITSESVEGITLNSLLIERTANIKRLNTDKTISNSLAIKLQENNILIDKQIKKVLSQMPTDIELIKGDSKKIFQYLENEIGTDNLRNTVSLRDRFKNLKDGEQAVFQEYTNLNQLLKEGRGTIAKSDRTFTPAKFDKRKRSAKERLDKASSPERLNIIRDKVDNRLKDSVTELRQTRVREEKRNVDTTPFNQYNPKLISSSRFGNFYLDKRNLELSNRIRQEVTEEGKAKIKAYIAQYVSPDAEAKNVKFTAKDEEKLLQLLTYQELQPIKIDEKTIAGKKLIDKRLKERIEDSSIDSRNDPTISSLRKEQQTIDKYIENLDKNIVKGTDDINDLSESLTRQQAETIIQKVDSLDREESVKRKIKKRLQDVYKDGEGGERTEYADKSFLQRIQELSRSSGKSRKEVVNQFVFNTDSYPQLRALGFNIPENTSVLRLSRQQLLDKQREYDYVDTFSFNDEPTKDNTKRNLQGLPALQRARRVAITEVTTAFNIGRLVAFQEKGVRYVKVVTDLEINRNAPCLFCKEVEERTSINPIPLELLFNVNDEKYASEGFKIEGSVHIPFHPFCRCYYVPVEVEDDEKAKGDSVIRTRSFLSNLLNDPGLLILTVSVFIAAGLLITKLNSKTSSLTKRISDELVPTIDQLPESIRTARGETPRPPKIIDPTTRSRVNIPLYELSQKRIDDKLAELLRSNQVSFEELDAIRSSDDTIQNHYNEYLKIIYASDPDFNPRSIVTDTIEVLSSRLPLRLTGMKNAYDRAYKTVLNSFLANEDKFITKTRNNNPIEGVEEFRELLNKAKGIRNKANNDLRVLYERSQEQVSLSSAGRTIDESYVLNLAKTREYIESVLSKVDKLEAKMEAYKKNPNKKIRELSTKNLPIVKEDLVLLREFITRRTTDIRTETQELVSPLRQALNYIKAIKVNPTRNEILGISRLLSGEPNAYSQYQIA